MSGSCSDRSAAGRRSVLICLVGIDGAGKTTLARRLVQAMQAHGLKSRYVWGGFQPTVFLRPAVWLVKRLMYREERHTRFSERKGRVLKNRRLAALYHHVVLADYVVQILWRVRLPLLLGNSVICDRYIHDLAITTALVLDYPDDGLLRLLRRLERFTPRPDQVLVADLPEAVAYERKGDIPSLAFLEERRRRYQRVAQAQGLAMLDARQPADALAAHVTTQVLQTCQEERPS